MMPVPSLQTVCKRGAAMAACPVLRLLVTSSHDDLTVFLLPESIVATSSLTPIRTIGGSDSGQPMNFKFRCGGNYCSGWMAFTGSTAATRLLVVTDGGNDAVHVIDVVRGHHVGYVAVPGSTAARGSKVAVTACESNASGFVRLYEGSGASWTMQRIICGSQRTERNWQWWRTLRVLACICFVRRMGSLRVAWPRTCSVPMMSRSARVASGQCLAFAGWFSTLVVPAGEVVVIKNSICPRRLPLYPALAWWCVNLVATCTFLPWRPCQG